MPYPTNKIGALYAYDITRDGTSTERDPNLLSTCVRPQGGYRWVHLDLAHEGAEPWIVSQADALVASSLTLEDTRPRCNRHNGGLLLILRGVNLNPAADPEDMVSIRLWIHDGLIISVRRSKLMAIVALRESIDAGNAPTSIGEFVTELAHGMTERMTPVIDDLADELDALEETSLDEPQGLRSRLAELRRTIIKLRRYVGPQREALGRLGAEGKQHLNEEAQISLRETVDRITRLVEDMDSIRERCGILNDQLADQRAEEMNRNMMVLSVVAAIFLPLGFLTGLLGVNVGGIPGTDSPIAFSVLCAAMMAIGVTITLFFKKLKWI